MNLSNRWIGRVGNACALLCVASMSLAFAGCDDECHDGDCHEDAGPAVDTGTASLTEAYCNCLLTSCHDAYHAVFGPATDEPAARAACLAEAAVLPRAGMDVESGNFLECRLHFCRAGASDESLCPGSVGDAPCQ